jgi:CRP-like cAMP-binding protein
VDIFDEIDGLEQRVRARLEELRSDPAVAEWERLRTAATRLGIAVEGPRTAAAETSLPAREPPAPTAAVRPSTPRRGRAPEPPSAPPVPDSTPAADVRFADVAMLRGWRRGGSRQQKPRRADDVLRLVQSNPGITIREVAEELGVDPTGLYRVVGDLRSDGLVRKDGRGLHPVGDGAGEVA